MHALVAAILDHAGFTTFRPQESSSIIPNALLSDGHGVTKLLGQILGSTVFTDILAVTTQSNTTKGKSHTITYHTGILSTYILT